METSPSDSQISGTRLRRAILICAWGWGLFMLESLLRGNWRSAQITGVVCAATALVWAVSLYTFEPRRLVHLVRWNILIAYSGLLASALTHGYSASPAAWLVGLIPLHAAYHLQVRDTLVCALVAAGLVVAIATLEPSHPVATEFIFSGTRLLFAQLLNVVLVLAFAVNASRTHRQQLAIIRQQHLEVEAARDAALEAAEVKSRFLANMSHEIRTPLNGILGLADLLGDSRLEEQQRHWLQVIQGSGRLLVGVLNDILDYSKLDAGSLHLESIEFDLESLVMNVIDMFYAEARRKGIELVAVIAPEAAGSWRGDPLRVGQILLNLTSNGVKFTTEGQVVVRVGKAAQGIEFRVVDTGIGIAQDKLERLFRPFHQVDSSITRHYGGTGLGLAISQRMAGLMGGPIVADSQPGSTSFSFQLPLQQIQPAPLWSPSIKAYGLTALEQESWQAMAATLPPSPISLIQGDDPGVPGPKLLVTYPEQDELRQGALERGFQGNLVHPLRSSQLHAWLKGSTPVEAPQSRESFSLHVLVTEDNAVNRRVMCSILEAVGITPKLAETGAEALQLVDEQDFDLIFMDLHMPTMDGIEATRRIRQRPGHQPHIVAVSADVLGEARSAMEQAGANGFLSKPLERRLVYDLLRKISPRS